MARKLTEKEFIRELSKIWNCSYESAKIKYYEFIEFIINEVSMYGYIELPTFGSFKTELIQGKYTYLPAVQKGDSPEPVLLDPYERIKFHASTKFKGCLNGKNVTKAETLRHIKKIKQAEISQKEYDKQASIIENRELIMQKILEKKQKTKESNQRSAAKNKLKNINTLQNIDLITNDYWSNFEE